MTSFPSVLESVNDLTNDQIIELFKLANNIENDKVLLEEKNSLKKPTIYTLFLEDSTRTKLSFASCAQKIGAHYLDFPIHTSSMNKGENLEETLLTLKAQGADLVIIRAKECEILNQFTKNPPIKLINGGDGKNEHPTQALLDFYFLQKTIPLELNELKNFTLGIAGDVIHSRVAHSLMKLLPRFGVKVALFGPTHFIPQDLHQYFGKDITVYNDKQSFLKNIDLLYLLRIQLERHNNDMVKNRDELKNEYLEKYGFCENELCNFKNKYIKVMHPGPVNVGLELDLELLKSPRYLGLNQVEVSMPVRMAILLQMLNNNDIKQTTRENNAKRISYSIL